MGGLTIDESWFGLSTIHRSKDTSFFKHNCVKLCAAVKMHVALTIGASVLLPCVCALSGPAERRLGYEIGMRIQEISPHQGESSLDPFSMAGSTELLINDNVSALSRQLNAAALRGRDNAQKDICERNWAHPCLKLSLFGLALAAAETKTTTTVEEAPRKRT